MFTRSLLRSVSAHLLRSYTRCLVVHDVATSRVCTRSVYLCARACGLDIRGEYTQKPRSTFRLSTFLSFLSLSSCNRREMWVVQQGIVQSLGKRQYTRAHFHNLRISLLWFKLSAFMKVKSPEDISAKSGIYCQVRRSSRTNCSRVFPPAQFPKSTDESVTWPRKP